MAYHRRDLGFELLKFSHRMLKLPLRRRVIMTWAHLSDNSHNRQPFRDHLIPAGPFGPLHRSQCKKIGKQPLKRHKLAKDTRSKEYPRLTVGTMLPISI